MLLDNLSVSERKNKGRTVLGALGARPDRVEGALEFDLSSPVNDLSTDKPSAQFSESVMAAAQPPRQKEDELIALLPEPWDSPNQVLDAEELDFQQAYGVLRNGYTEYAIDLFQEFFKSIPYGAICRSGAVLVGGGLSGQPNVGLSGSSL
jgi:hypothetical protein